MCYIQIVHSIYPLIVVGLVAVVIVHVGVLEAFDNLETYLNVLVYKKHA